MLAFAFSFFFLYLSLIADTAEFVDTVCQSPGPVRINQALETILYLIYSHYAFKDFVNTL